MSTFRRALELAANTTIPSIELPQDRTLAAPLWSELARKPRTGKESGSSLALGHPSWENDGLNKVAPQRLYLPEQVVRVRYAYSEGDPYSIYRGGLSEKDRSTDFIRDRRQAFSREVTQAQGIHEDYDQAPSTCHKTHNDSDHCQSSVDQQEERGRSGDLQLQHPRPVRFTDLDSLKVSVDYTTPSESELRKSNSGLYGGPAKIKSQARQINGDLLRDTFGHFGPNLPSNAQCHVSRGTVDEVIKTEGHNGGELHVDTLRSMPNRRVEEDSFSSIERELEELLSDSTDERDDTLDAHKRPTTYLEPPRYGLHGNPFAGNVRAKYLALTGLDVVELASRWTDDANGIANDVSERVESQAMEKFNDFVCNMRREMPPSAEREMQIVRDMDPPHQIMHLTWPGVHPVSNLALHEYEEFLYDSGYDHEYMDERMKDLNQLSSESRLQQFRSDPAFWEIFERRMGLLGPDSYLDAPEEWLNEAGLRPDFETLNNERAYVGPILYPSRTADTQTLDVWLHWHGPELDKERRKRDLIRLIDSNDYERNAPPSILKEQYSYLQGLDFTAVDEYHEVWSNESCPFFDIKRDYVFEKWGIPKGYEIMNEIRESSLGTSVGSQQDEPISGAPGCSLLLTPADSSSESPELPPIPGLAGFSHRIHKSVTPVSMMSPPIDVVDIGIQEPRNNVKPTTQSRIGHEHSSPPYVESLIIPVVLPHMDTENFGAASASSLMAPPKSRQGPRPALSSANQESTSYVLIDNKEHPATAVPPTIFTPAIGSAESDTVSSAYTPSRKAFRDIPSEMNDVMMQDRSEISSSLHTSTESSLSQLPKPSPGLGRSSINEQDIPLPVQLEPRSPPLPTSKPLPSSRRKSTSKIAKPKPRPKSRTVSTKILKNKKAADAPEVRSKVEQAVRKIETAVCQADGSPPRRSGRIRAKVEG
ncbi:hypothetical protein UCRPC4_g04436 [Phaeomoniella chlamydospora]|uniref:Uncharacterized protein n=1 Tax=Phaeomoniella chlamydospora TaxID=158046 RepID=A0A0G2GSG9_PHACM|nr:hypothetical protein UCRPC4_g04436 [Phaeomoniella chlamydospora]